MKKHQIWRKKKKSRKREIWWWIRSLSKMLKKIMGVMIFRWRKWKRNKSQRWVTSKSKKRKWKMNKKKRKKIWKI